MQISIRPGCRQPVLSLDAFKIINLSGMWWLFVISMGEIIEIRLASCLCAGNMEKRKSNPGLF